MTDQEIRAKERDAAARVYQGSSFSGYEDQVLEMAQGFERYIRTGMVNT